MDQVRKYLGNKFTISLVYDRQHTIIGDYKSKKEKSAKNKRSLKNTTEPINKTAKAASATFDVCFKADSFGSIYDLVNDKDKGITPIPVHYPDTKCSLNQIEVWVRALVCVFSCYLKRSLYVIML